MKYLLIGFLVFLFSLNNAKAQHVKVRLGFPSGVVVGAPGPAPFAGGIWIGPEWRWQGGRYVHVPGYWARPHRGRGVWVPGRWQYSRRGYVWRGGRWR